MYLNIEQPPSFASSVRLATRRFASTVERATSRSHAATVRQCRKIKSVWSVNLHSHDETLRHFFSDFENFQSPTEWRKVKCSAKLWIKKKRNRRMRRHVVPCHCLSLFDGRRRRTQRFSSHSVVGHRANWVPTAKSKPCPECVDSPGRDSNPHHWEEGKDAASPSCEELRRLRLAAESSNGDGRPSSADKSPGQRLSLNRSQWGGCSTDYDTPTEN